MNIGIDVHGTITQYPYLFAELSYRLHNNGHKVHIITGIEGHKVLNELTEHDIYSDYIFSIVDFQKSRGAEMWERTKANGRKSWYCDEKIWNVSKGEYCMREHIDILFDDTAEYAKHVPEFTTFILVPKVGFQQFYTRLNF